MAETKFTPGPWQGCLHLRSNADETCSCGYRGGIWSTATDTMICEIGGPVGAEGDDMIPRGDRPTQIADHWLIAASTDLYAACELALSTLETSGVLEKTVQPHLRAALAKARGEPLSPSPSR